WKMAWKRGTDQKFGSSCSQREAHRRWHHWKRPQDSELRVQMSLQPTVPRPIDGKWTLQGSSPHKHPNVQRPESVRYSSLCLLETVSRFFSGQMKGQYHRIRILMTFGAAKHVLKTGDFEVG